MAHDAFISYSRKDGQFAIRLHKALANYIPPKDLPLPHRRLDVFLDAQDFTGAEYYQALDRHLNSSGKLIVLCSPKARDSKFVNDEIQRFARAKGAENIIALLVAGLPNNEATPEQRAQMAFPDALCEAMKMPLAADYRGFDPKRSKVDRGPYEASWYTTLANIYDVSRAQIEQREKKRRAHRRQITMAAVAASVIVLAGLSLIAWKQRQERVRQQSVAAARLLAGRAEAVASGSTPLSQSLRLRALIAAESLRKAWTSEGYNAWRRAALQMPPILGRIPTDSGLIRMAFTADGKRLFALCGERHIHVFSVPDLQELKKFEANETAYQLTIDSKGEHVLAYQVNDEFLEAFDVLTGVKRNVHLPTNFLSASFNPSGDAIVTALTNLWVLDATSDKVHSRIVFPKETSAVMLSPDGATVVALTDKTVTAHDTVEGKVRWHLPLSGEAGREIVFSGDGRFAMVKGSGELSIVNAMTGGTLKSLPVRADSRGRAMLFSDDAYAIGNEVYKISGDAALALPFAEESAPPLGLPAVSASGRYIAGIPQNDKQNLAVVDLSIKSRSVADDPASFYLTLQDAYQGKVATFTSDGNLMALSSGTMGYGQKQTAELQLVSLKPEHWRPIIPSRSRTGDLNVSPSGRFAARLERGTGWIVTDTTNKRSVTIPENGSPIEFSPDEQRVLVFPSIYALDNPTSPQTISHSTPFSRTWSFPGSSLVIGVDVGSMSMSDTRKSTLFDWHTDRVSDGPASVNSIYAISPDGRRFVTYDHDVIQLWATGATKPDVRSDRASVSNDTPVYFSPDGTLLAVAKCRGVPLYDARTLEVRFEIPIGHSCFAGFSLDGKYVVSSASHSDAPEPTLHPITLAGVLEETCSKVRDNLTQREWERLGVAAIKTCPDRSPAPSGSTPPPAQ